jgi:hypothetical protein
VNGRAGEYAQNGSRPVTIIVIGRLPAFNFNTGYLGERRVRLTQAVSIGALSSPKIDVDIAE